MDDWVYVKNYRKQKRILVSDVKRINREIEKDELWNGRFVVRFVGSPIIYTYEDNSGMVVGFNLIVIDKLTGQYVQKFDSVASWHHFNCYEIWRFVNDAIVEEFDTWKGNQTPYEQRKIDWKNIPVNEKDLIKIGW